MSPKTKPQVGDRLPYLLGKLKTPRVLERLEQARPLFARPPPLATRPEGVSFQAAEAGQSSPGADKRRRTSTLPSCPVTRLTPILGYERGHGDYRR